MVMVMVGFVTSAPAAAPQAPHPPAGVAASAEPRFPSCELPQAEQVVLQPDDLSFLGARRERVQPLFKHPAWAAKASRALHVMMKAVCGRGFN